MLDEQAEMLEMHAIMHGHVQGVFFRATTKNYAELLGLQGTVKNRADGNVEIFAQGPRDKLEKLLERLTAESGPGRVERVEKEFYPSEGRFSDFRVIH